MHATDRHGSLSVHYFLIWTSANRMRTSISFSIIISPSRTDPLTPSAASNNINGAEQQVPGSETKHRKLWGSSINKAELEELAAVESPTSRLRLEFNIVLILISAWQTAAFPQTFLFTQPKRQALNCASVHDEICTLNYHKYFVLNGRN